MRRFFAALLITVLITAACTGETDPIPITRTQSAVPSTITPSPPASQTTIAQATTLPSPTPTPLPTATPLPSPTPTRTPRPTPTSTATPITYYALPDWVDDPNVPVLLGEGLGDRFSNSSISLFNVLTGERWDILSNTYTADFEWYQNEDGLFIELTYPISTQIGAPGPLLVQISVPDGNFREYLPHPFGALSNNRQALVRIIRETGDPVKVSLVTGYELGQEAVEGTLLIDPFDGQYGSGASASWSSDDEYIAISRYAFPEVFGDPNKHGLAIYSANGQLFRTYDGIDRQQWSTVNPPRILYPLDVAGNHQIPCILNIITSESQCFYNLESWQEERGVNIYQFRWSPDGSQISFVAYDDPALCIMELITENVSCPVQESQLIMNNTQFHVIGHDRSADGRYLSFNINPQGPRSQDGGFNYLGVVTAEGEDFRILDRTISNFQTARIWRPILPDLQDE